MTTWTRSEIIEGMATAIWSHARQFAVHAGVRRSEVDRATPPEAARAARDLAKAYEALNGQQLIQIAHRMNAANQTQWKNTAAKYKDMPRRAEDFDNATIGEMLAQYALDGVSGADTHFRELYDDMRPRIRIPMFRISLKARGNAVELGWEGGEERTGQDPRGRGARSPRRHSHRNPTSRHPETKSITQVREILASRDPDRKCHPTCQGWEIFVVDRDPGLEIERCDECSSEFDDGLMDDDVEQLPEAQLALAKAFEREDEEERQEVEAAVREIHGGKVVPRGNPEGQFYAFRYEGGWRTKPKEYWGPFPSKAQAEAAARADVAKYGSGTYVVKQLDDRAFHALWHGPQGRPPGVPNPRRRNPSIEEDLGIEENPGRRVAGRADFAQVGYDLTEFAPGGFQRVLSGLGIEPHPGMKLPGIGGYVWTGDGIRIVTGNDPITGRYYRPDRRAPEVNYASYMGLEGTRSKIQLAKRLIAENAVEIKGGPDRGLHYIDFSGRTD